MHIVFCYDIPDDKRRTRLRKTLLRFGTPVQYSVFECELTNAQFTEMRKAVRAVVKKSVDNVRYYELCYECAARTESHSGKELVRQQSLYIV